MKWELNTIDKNKLNNVSNKIDAEFLAERLSYNLNITRTELDKYIDVEEIRSLIAILLINRELDDNVEILNRPQDYFIDPRELHNAIEAAERIYRYSQDTNATIYIYADYDADGLTAGYVMKKALQQVAKCSIILHYPNRIEGYGLSLDFCKAIVDEHGDNANILVLTVDNGITKYKEVEYLNEHGIECIITDHHTSKKGEVPNCLVVDPHNYEVEQNDTFRHLCGCGIAFKVAQLVQHLHGMNDMYQYLPYLAISTITDVMPMHTENLAILQYGLDIINSKDCPLGIKEYKEQESIDYMTCKDIGWTLGPMLNACGRMGDTELGSKLFFGEEDIPMRDIVSKIKSVNEKRKRETKKIVAILNNTPEDSNSTFIWNISKITPGIVGIIAGKAADRFNKPSIIVTSKKNGILHGSARSAQGVNLMPVMEILRKEDLILEYGGHAEAVGIHFEESKTDAIRERLNELIVFETKERDEHSDLFSTDEEVLHIDEYLTLENLNVVMLALSNMLPVDGRQLKEATFAITDCEVKSFKVYPSGYMELTLKQGNTTLDMSAMGYAQKFSTEILPLLDGKDKKMVNIAGSISKHFKSKKYVLNIVDIVVA